MATATATSSVPSVSASSCRAAIRSDQVGQAKRRFRQAKVAPEVTLIRPGDAPIAELVASGVPVEPVARKAREPRHGAPGGRRPRRDGDRPHRDGDRARRPYGERRDGDRGRGPRPSRTAY